MSASLRNQQGFSLPEVMLAMVLMVMIVTALSGFQRTLMNSLACREGILTLKVCASWPTPLRKSASFAVNDSSFASFCPTRPVLPHTPSPGGREGEMTRLHCPNRQ